MTISKGTHTRILSCNQYAANGYYFRCGSDRLAPTGINSTSASSNSVNWLRVVSSTSLRYELGRVADNTWVIVRARRLDDLWSGTVVYATQQQSREGGPPSDGWNTISSQAKVSRGCCLLSVD
jgi:hypothetical protein